MKTIVAVVAVIACAACASTEESPSLDIVAARAPVITSVATGDGFTQVRQGTTASLVIRGKKLGKTTGVAVGPFAVMLDSVAAREVRVTVFTSNQTPGPVDVTVTSADGSITAPAAIELTPFVVSPTAATGRGTFQSPTNLCDPELEFTGPGAIILLLAGSHRCGQRVHIGGGTVSGDPDHATVVTGTDEGGVTLALANNATIRDLTFAPPLGEWSIVSGGGDLVLERIVDVGGVFADGNVTVDRYTYEGEGTALTVSGGQITQSTFRHCGSGRAIQFSPSSTAAGLSIDSVLVEDCDVGVSAGGRANIANSQFIDTRTAIVTNGGSIHDVVIRDDEATTRESQFGIVAGSDDIGLRNIEITGVDTGLAVFHFSSDGREALVFGDGLVITGGSVGIRCSGLDNQLTIRNSIVRDQTVASLALSNLDGVTNFGTASDPGNNQLSVVSGFAIDDSRHTETPGRFIRAVGTTLNGVSFAGQTIAGPAELAPFYRFLESAAGIEF